MGRNRNTRRAQSLIVALSVATALGACSSSTGSSGAVGTKNTSASGRGVAHARSQISALEGKPEFKAVGPAFDAKKVMKGKSILSIPVSSDDPFPSTLDKNMSSVADQIGFKFKVWTNAGQSTQWVQGMNSAVNQNYNLVDLIGGTDPAVLGPQTKMATQAGLKVVVSHYSGIKQSVPATVTGNVPVNYELAGRLLADWVIQRTGGKASVLVIESKEVRSTAAMVDNIQAELKSYCDSCTVQSLNVPVPKWSSGIQSNVQSILQAHPDIDYILPIYDSMTPFVIAALKITQLEGKVKIASFNGTPQALELVKNGDLEMDVAENTNWVSYAIMDAEMRMLGKIAPADSDSQVTIPIDAPFSIVTQDVAKKMTGNPVNLDSYFGDEYIQRYKALWQLK